ncbi:MAG TPA: ferredoxin family protein, partial [Pirellulaceae bacterium]|nr:ferredoxin family protein [Pirellulaceae bacterium]
MAKRIAVVVSQGQSQNPAKRGLEEDIVTALIMESGIEVTVIPHLYDLKADGTGMLALQSIKGNLIVLSWLYERGAHWVLDRNGIHGHVGQTLIKPEDDEDEEEPEATVDKDRVIQHRNIPNRRIYCIDLRVYDTAQPYIDEIKRIANENEQKLVQLGGWLDGTPRPEQVERFAKPTNSTALSVEGSQLEAKTTPAPSDSDNGNGEPVEVIRIEETGGRRWYP